MSMSYRMTEPLLLQFIDNVYSANVDYCYICLRSSEERRLEQPNYLKKFVQSLNHSFVLNSANQLVCFVCERQAAAAFRFRLAADVASHTHSVIMKLIKSPTLRKQVVEKFYSGDLQGMEQQTGSGTVTKSLRCEAQVRRLRARTQLLYTEVLVVSTPSTAAPDAVDFVGDFRTPDNYIELTLGPGQSCDQYVVPDDTPVDTPLPDLKSEPGIKMESIVIYDDDDPLCVINNEDTEPPTNSNNTILISDVVNNTVTKQLIAPRVYTNQSRLASKAHIADPTPPVKPQKNPLLQQLLDKQSQVIVGTSPTTNFILHPIIFNSGMLTVPSLAGNIINGQLITSDNSHETPQLALQNGENIDFISDPSKVTNTLKMLSHQDAPKVHIFKSVPTSECNSVSVQCSDGFSISDVNHVNVNKAIKNIKDCPKDAMVSAKTPELRTDRIDWEEKIPMDVISFMDADENSSKRARRENDPPPPLGICNVTSLYQTKTDDVIDLC